MIISVSGKMCSGKDTFAQIIKEIDHSYQIKHFADKLKEVASTLLGVPVGKFYDQDFKATELPSEWSTFIPQRHNGKEVEPMEIPMTVREFLQKLGTEAIRDGIHTNAWVNSLMSGYKDMCLEWDEEGNSVRSGKPNWIIADTRFPNEIQAVIDQGGILVRIERDKRSTINADHPSETALDDFKDWDFVIDNNGSLEDLRMKAEGLLNIVNRK